MTDHDPHGPAIGVIVRQLARARDDGADDDWAARSILTALQGLGWRPRIEPPPVPSGEGLDPVTLAVAAAKARAGIQRHTGHGADVTCRPAGNGLCEPYSGGTEVTG